MTTKKPATETAANKAIRRAISKSRLRREPPTVGKPVIIDPVERRDMQPDANSKTAGRRENGAD
jgi:hypothetical protein